MIFFAFISLFAVQVYEIHIFILSHVNKYRISVPYMLGLKKLQYVIQRVGKIGVFAMFLSFSG